MAGGQPIAQRVAAAAAVGQSCREASDGSHKRFLLRVCAIIDSELLLANETLLLPSINT